MRLGLFLSLLGGRPEAYAGVVGAAEVAGLDSVWVPDHVLKVFGPVLDPLTALAFLAGSTSRIKLGTGVLVLSYRHPVVLANVASTSTCSRAGGSCSGQERAGPPQSSRPSVWASANAVGGRTRS